jgi:ribonuclease BN (tRNA processing enzyme)
VKVQFLGSGDAFGSDGRFNTCIQVMTDAGIFLIDCGASSVVAMRKFGVDPNAIGAIFISHLHGDHFGGLPFFLLDAQFYSRRTAPLALFGPTGFSERLNQAMEVFFPGSSSTPRKFTMDITEIHPGQRAEWSNVIVHAFEVRHPCGAPPMALRFEVADKTLVYSGDTEWTEALVKAGHGADLFIAEALSYEKNIPHHLSYTALRANAARIGAKRIVLTHMGPDMLAHAEDAPEEKAYDGLILEL